MIWVTISGVERMSAVIEEAAGQNTPFFAQLLAEVRRCNVARFTRRRTFVR